jgi:putative tricarboxylic transport membrane protein
MVIHSGPGSGADLFVRAMGSILEKEKLLTQRLQINHKTGGGGAVAMAYLAEKKGEAHTLALFTTVWVVVPLTSAEAKVTLMDLTPIARMVVEPAVVVVKANSPYRNMQDFIAAAKKNPGQLKQSGGSFTSVDNLTRLLVQKATGANWAFISFPGGAERLANLLGEHVQIMFLQPQEAGEHIRAGNLRMIATLTEKRLASFPDIPTVGEQGIRIPIPEQARGVVAPPGIPADAKRYWEDLFSRLTKTPSWKKYLEENQLEDSFLGSAESAKFFDSSTAQMRGLLVEAGAKVAR